MCIRIGAVLIGLLFFSACAVVEPLTGGDRDVNAPVPNLEEMSPQNGSTNFNGKQITIPFNEFFRLNNPTENIVVIPPDIKPTAKIKNKKLVLSWEEDLRPNTTYAFYLNGAVQDISESNDSLMSFVFSTGPTIDSLSALIEIRDAFEQTALPGQTVGLYNRFLDTILPNYFGKTNASGRVLLNYMKPGTYELVTFNDENKNLKPDIIENFGFQQGTFELEESIVDTTIVLSSARSQKAKITTLKLIAPSTIVVAANRSLENAKYFLNGQLMPDEHIFMYDADSVLLPFQWTDSANYALIVETENWSDTSGFRMQEKDKNVALKLTPIKKENIFHDEAIRFLSNHTISSLDVPLVKLKNPTDSTDIPLRRINALGTKIEVDFVRNEEINTVEVIFLPKAIQSPTGTNEDTLKYRVKVLSKKEVGSLTVKLEGFSSAVVLDLLKKGELAERIPLKQGVDQHVFNNLLPDEYSFRVTIDQNENGRWDAGDWSTKTPPEDVKSFLKSNRVRGNWDTEITLQLNGI